MTRENRNAFETGAITSMVPISVCICSFDRVSELRRCLDSLALCSPPPTEIIVSDDAADGTPTVELCARYPRVTYVRGPQNGIAANRNASVAKAVQPWITLVDDDAVIRREYWSAISRLCQQSPGKTIYTGKCINHVGNRSFERIPGCTTRLGFFGSGQQPPLENIDLSSNLIPANAFQAVQFDPALVYGYEDMDWCNGLLRKGYRIEYQPEMVNDHIPPDKTADDERSRVLRAEWARGYCLFKKHFYWKTSSILAWAMLGMYGLHRLASSLKRADLWTILRVGPDTYSIARAVRRLR